MARRLVAVAAAAAMLALTPVDDAQADPTDVKPTTETGAGQWFVDSPSYRSGTPGAWELRSADTTINGTWELGGTTYDGFVWCDDLDPCFTGSTTSGSWDSRTEEGVIDGIEFVGGIFQTFPHTSSNESVYWVEFGEKCDSSGCVEAPTSGTYTRTGTGDDGDGGVEPDNLWQIRITTDVSLMLCEADTSNCTYDWSSYPVELDLTAAFVDSNENRGAYTQTSGAEPLVDLQEATIAKPSTECKDNGGTRVVDLTSQGVRTALYTHQPSSDEVWVCTRVEDTTSGDGYGGKLVIDSAGADPQVSGGPDSPSTDGDSTACTTTTDPPNQVPGSHPIAHGGVGSFDVMVDAYANSSEAWLCLEAGSTQTRVVVPYDDPIPDVTLGNVVAWQPDQGTPGG